MPRAVWKGAISFGLITIPVSLYSATEAKDVSFRQVHEADGGRIRYKRVCEKCGEEIPYADIAKGYEAPDGRLAVLTAADMESLPLASSKAVEVVQFVDESEIDPVYFEKSYLIEPVGVGVKPYVLLRNALAQTGKSAVVKVALRSRESLALIRAKDKLLVMDTMLWPDEIRDGTFAEPDEDIKVSNAEVAMAQTFIEQLSGDWAPDTFEDSYRAAVEEVVAAKLAGTPMPEGEPGTSQAGGQVVDLVAALRASVDAARKRRAEAAKESQTPAKAS